MTVTELIEWLKTQHPDAIVEVVKHDRKGSYYEQGGTASVETFTVELSTATESFTFGDKHYPRTLLLGESD